MLSQTAELLQRKHYPLWAQLMRCCGKPQAVRGRVGSSLLDSGVPLPPVVCPGSSAKRVHCRGSGTKWRNPAVTSEPPRHLQWRPVWELVLPGQWNKRRRESFSFLWLTETVETNTWSQQSTFKNSLDSPRDSYQILKSDHAPTNTTRLSLVIHSVNNIAPVAQYISLSMTLCISSVVSLSPGL